MPVKPRKPGKYNENGLPRDPRDWTVVRVEYDAGNAACKPGGRVTIDEAVRA